MKQYSVGISREMVGGDRFRLFARRDKIRSEESPLGIKCRGGGSRIAQKVFDFLRDCDPSKPIVPFNMESSGV